MKSLQRSAFCSQTFIIDKVQHNKYITPGRWVVGVLTLLTSVNSNMVQVDPHIIF